MYYSRPGPSHASDFTDPEFLAYSVAGQRYRKVVLPKGTLDLYANAGGKRSKQKRAVDAGGFAEDDEDDESDVEWDEEDEGRWTFLEVEDKFEYKLPMAVVYFRFVIGSGRKTLNRIMSESGTDIFVPGVEDAAGGGDKSAFSTGLRNEGMGEIVIKARERKSIKAAKGLLEFTAEEADAKIPMTHFLNIPVSVSEFVKVKFKDFLDSKPALDLNPHYFQSPEKLHFTLIMLKLHTQEKIDKVKEICEVFGRPGSDFQQILRQVIFAQIGGASATTSNGGGANANGASNASRMDQRTKLDTLVRLRGLHYMNDDPTRVAVLHTEPMKADGRNRTATSVGVPPGGRPTPAGVDFGVVINTIAGLLFDALIRNDVVTKEYLQQQRLLNAKGEADVKLHCTLVNTSFYVRHMERTGQWSVEKAGEEMEKADLRVLNATPLLSAFGSDADFGMFDLAEAGVHFSNLLRTDADTKYYDKVAEIKLDDLKG
eukprot:g8381.t1